MELKSVLISAYAKTPQNTIMYEWNKSIGIVLEIDKETNTVIDAEAMFITDVAKNFFKRLVIGVDFGGDITELLQAVESHYLTISQTALNVALKSAHQKYQDTYLKKTK